MFLICTLHAHSPTVRFIPGNIMCKLSVGIDDFFWEGMAAFDRKHPPKTVVINGQINTDVLDSDLLAELEEAFAPEDAAEEPDAEPDGDPEDGGQDSEQDCMSSSKSTSSDSSTSSTSNASNPANNASEDVNAGSDMPVQQQVEDVPAALPKAAPAPKPAPRDAAHGSLTSMIANPMASFATSGRTSPCTRIVVDILHAAFQELAEQQKARTRPSPGLSDRMASRVCR